MIRGMILFLLLPGFLSASSIKRLDDLRDAVFYLTGYDTVGTNQLTESIVNNYVNIAIQKVSTDYPVVEKSKTFTCVDGVSSYAIDDSTFRELKWCRIWKEQSEEGIHPLYPLKVVPAELIWDFIQAGQTIPGAEDEPGYVYTWAETLHVQPVPIYPDTIKYGYLAVGMALSSDSDTTDVLPKYRDLIVLFASILVKKDMKQDYSVLWVEYEAEKARVLGEVVQ